jgi:hypothetical protein
MEYDGQTVVLDIGAGDGILVHFLNQYVKGQNIYATTNSMKRKQASHKIKKQMQLPMIIAIDDGSWKIKPKAKVEKLSLSEALQQYNPFDSNRTRNHQLIVICSWMPTGVDWTQQIRDNHVDEYILIGECDDGICGDNWLTFGNPIFRDDVYTQDNDWENSNMIAPYVIDGFVRTDLDELSRLQYSRFDSKMSGSSKTVSFRRKNSRSIQC